MLQNGKCVNRRIHILTLNHVSKDYNPHLPHVLTPPLPFCQLKIRSDGEYEGNPAGGSVTASDCSAPGGGWGG